MPGFFDSAMQAYNNSLNTIMKEYGTPGSPKLSKNAMNMALNWAPMAAPVAYHATIGPLQGAFKQGTHFGSPRAAYERILMKAGLAQKDAQLVASNPTMFKRVIDKLQLSGAQTIPVDLDLGKTLAVSDDAANNLVGVLDKALKSKIINKAEKDEVFKSFMSKAEEGAKTSLWELLKSKGIDALEYVNEVEDVGSISYQILNTDKIKSFFETQAAKKKK